MYSRKRGPDDHHDSQPRKKAFNGFKDNCSCNIKVLVSPELCGKILGKKGATITQLQQDHNVHMALSKFGNFYPGTESRVCLISGNSPDDVSKALDFIVDNFEEQNDGKKKIKLAMSNSTVGMVLGKRGADIQKLKNDTGVSWLAFGSKDDATVNTERLLTCVGNVSAVSEAFQSILETVNRDKHNGNDLQVDYEQGGGYGDSRRDDRGEFGDRSGRRSEFSSAPRHDPYSGGRDSRGGRDDYSRSRPPPFNSDSHSSSGGGLMGLLGLDMRVTIPERSVGKPLTSAVIDQLLDHVQGKLLKTSYTSSEIRTIETSIANLSSLGLMSLGLVDKPSNGYGGSSDYSRDRDSGRDGWRY